MQRARARAYSVLFLGNDGVSLPTLAALHASLRGEGAHARLVQSLAVVCGGERRPARGGGAALLPVAAYCAAHGLRALTVPAGTRGADLMAAVPALAQAAAAADVGVVVSFGLLLPAPLLAALRGGALNMHPSLLPRWRGAAPVARAVLAGDGEGGAAPPLGVSVIEVHPSRFDAGALLAQRALPASGLREGCAALTARLAAAGADAMLETLADLSARRAAAAAGRGGNDDDPSAPRAPKFYPAHGLLTWRETGAGGGALPAAAATAGAGAATPPSPDSLTVQLVERMARAFDDSFGAHAYLDGARGAPPRRIRLLAVRAAAAHEVAALPAAAAGDAPGALRAVRAAPRQPAAALLRLVDGWLALDRVQLEARAALSGADFANGHLGNADGALLPRLVNPPPPS
jgi:methionyl-tRNA formyltransferase